MTQATYYAIQSPEQLKSLTNKVRLRILSIFTISEPKTCQQIADELSLPVGKIQYHVKELLDVGLFVEVESQDASPSKEMLYLPVAKEITIPIDFWSSSDNQQLAVHNSIAKSMVDQFVTEFRKALEFSNQKLEAGAIDTSILPLTNSVSLRLTREQQAEMREELSHLLHSWAQRYRGKQDVSEETTNWQCFISVFPDFDS